MALITHTLEGMYNGVSQQPAPLRFDNQFSYQENFTSDIVDGVTKRPNTEFVSLIDANLTDNTSVHNINQSIEDKYKVIFTGDPENPIEVIDLQGIRFEVDYETPEVKQYVSSSNPQKQIKTLSLSDMVVIVNSEVEVEVDYLDIEPLLNKTCMIYVKSGLPEVEYTAEIFDEDGISLGSSTVEKEPSSNLAVRTIKTEEIAEDLATKLQAHLPATNYHIETKGSVIIYQYTGTDKPWDEIDIKVSTNDSFGDTALIAINQQVNSFEDLPNKGVDHYPIGVTGTNGTEEGAFYLEYDSDEDIWRETRAILGTEGQYISDKLLEDTMPKALERLEDGSFLVKNIEWNENTVGDDKTSPMPSFVDKKISDIFFYRNRVGFLCEDNIIFSKGNEFFDLFPKTASSVLFDDPIDVEVASRQVVNLRNALTYNKTLVVFSEQAQFIVGSREEVLTPQNITVDTSTHFEALADCEPVQAGANIFFPVSKGNYTAVREYFVRADSHVDDAQDITSHVSRYIPDEIFKMTVSSAFDMLFMVSKATPNCLYVYKYLNGEDQKVQSAWFRWTLDPQDRILDVSMTDNWLYLITNNKETSDTKLIRMDLRRIKTGDLPIKIYLDEMTTVTGHFDETDEYTYFTLPYNVGIQKGDGYRLVDVNTGLALNRVERYSNTTLRVTGNYEGIEYYAGEPFKSTLEFSQFYIRNNQGMPDIQGKIQLKTITLAFSTSGEFKLKVVPDARHNIRDYVDQNEELITYMSHDVVENIYSSIILGESVVGKPPVITGEHTFPLTVNAKKARIALEADTYLPANFQLTAFEAEYNNRAQHL